MVSVVDADIIDKMVAAEPKKDAGARCLYWQGKPHDPYWRAEKGTRDYVKASEEMWCAKVEKEKEEATKEEEAQAKKAAEIKEKQAEADRRQKEEEEAAAAAKEAEEKKKGGKKKK